MDIIVTGSIAYDYLMRFPGRFTDHLMREKLDQVSLSFLVDDMTKHWGGNAANIAYTLALFGLHPKVMGDGRARLRRLPPVAGARRRRLQHRPPD